ncbi:hypothetical protein AVEN_84476-1, partial [Araneus ventricosus]
MTKEYLNRFHVPTENHDGVSLAPDFFPRTYMYSSKIFSPEAMASRALARAASVSFSLVILTSRFEATGGLFWEGPRNVEPRSDDEDTPELAGTPFPNFRTTPAWVEYH